MHLDQIIPDYAFPFFACAKKGTKKAHPILMRKISPLNHSLAKIGIQNPNCIEHFLSKIMQDGMSRLC